MFDSARVRGVKTSRMRWAVNQTAGNFFLLVTLGAKKEKLDWEWRERTRSRRSERWATKKSRSAVVSPLLAMNLFLLLLNRMTPRILLLSPRHCDLLPAVIARLLRRSSPQHLGEGMSWRWPLHKFESCSWPWIHVDTLKITAKGQGKDSSAGQSQWERTSRYPFAEGSKEKNRTVIEPVIGRSARRSL